MLTDKKLLKIKSGLHADGGGLYLRVSPKGKKTWVSRKRTQGKDSWKSVGTYPAMSLAEARRRMETRDRPDLGKAIDEYVLKIAVVRPDQVRQIMKPFPDIGATRQELVGALQKKAKKSPVMANRMLTRWKDFLNFCVQQGWLETNLLEPVQRRFIGGKENGRNRVLSWAEIAEITDPILRTILITGLRPSEALWVLRHKATQKIPTKRTPLDGYLHDLPESALIEEIFKQHLVLPASHLTMSNKLRRKGATFTPHDLRRTFATRLGDLGVMPHIVEKLLGHKMQGVMAVYNHADYWSERIAAQKLWEDKLSTLWPIASPV